MKKTPILYLKPPILYEKTQTWGHTPAQGVVLLAWAALAGLGGAQGAFFDRKMAFF
jgi:hypothetical protein